MSRRKKSVEEILNEEICPRVEKYPDLPEDEFIPIEYEHKILGLVNRDPDYIYLINKKGQIKRKKTDRLMNPGKNTGEYLDINLYFDRKTKISIRVHILVANTFLINSNPDKFTMVNHIDTNRQNNKLSNLEFVSLYGNSSVSAGKKNKISESKRVIYVGKDIKTNEEKFRITSSMVSRSFIDKVLKSMRYNKPYENCYWTKENTTKTKRENLYNLIGCSGNLSDYTWLKHPLYDNLWVCEEGFIRYQYYLNKTLKDEIIGSIKENGYIVISIKGEKSKLCAHRVIMEYKLGRKLKEDELVDHIDCNRSNNSFTNLKLSNYKENSNNPLTVEKLRSKVGVVNLFGNLILENSYWKDAYELMFEKEAPTSDCGANVITGGVGRIVNSKYICFDYKDPNKLNKILKGLDKAFYVITEDKSNILGAYYSLEEIGRSKVFKRHIDTITRHFKSGEPLDGLIIVKFKDAKDILIKTGNLNVLKKLNQTENKETNNKIEETQK